jgi:glyoxylase-like metal-dependent hydrolase (beta-lactamase superfamily II)
MRPATPPKFILEVALESIDRVLDLRPPPKRMIFAHYGLVEDPGKYLRAARDQLRSWVAVVRELHAENPSDFRTSAHERLLERDPWYAAFTRLDPDLQAREYHYTGQSLDGMRGYIAAAAG